MAARQQTLESSGKDACARRSNELRAGDVAYWCSGERLVSHGSSPPAATAWQNAGESTGGGQGMSMLDGVSQCWWLSNKCFVDWEAWSAIGTFFAAFLALQISLREQRRRREEALERALGLSTLLEPDVQEWHERIRKLRSHIQHDHAQAINESFETEGGDVLQAPASVRENLHRIHELHKAAQGLAVAVACAVAARKMKYQVRSALRPGAEDRILILNILDTHLEIADTELEKALEEINARIFAGPKKRPWWAPWRRW
ncbi:hypothetical protein [Stenotrophomonas maltophilia]|uniref:hypothetical protein n=2 Tax=Stenotrophomonas maltophilia TaxID=40324 RepID=UPI00117EFA80|nr:hypothetical protein [Stenotrophomonas maltophilia]